MVKTKAEFRKSCYSEVNFLLRTATGMHCLGTGSCGSNRDRDKNLQFSFVATSTPLSDCLNTVGGKSKFLFFVVMLDVPSLDIRITSVII